MAELAGVINAAQGRLVRLIARGLAEDAWGQAGVHTPAQWLTWKLGVAPARARQLLLLARRAAELPATVAALTDGEVSLDQASVVARHVPPAWEESAATLARTATVPQLTRALGRYGFEPPDPDRPAGSGPADPGDVSFGPTDGGRWRLHADLAADEGAVVERSLVRAHDELFHASSDGARVTWADALVAAAESSLASGEVGLPGANRFTVNVHLEADPAVTDGPGVMSLHLGHRLPTTLRRLLSCEADLRPVFERAGRAVSVGRAQRVVPGRTRRVVEHRDRGCRVPGCDRTRFLQIHHILHWEDGGATDTPNLVALCRRHHRLHHLGELGIAGDADRPDGLAFTDARGRELGPTGRPRAPDHLPDGPAYRHPTGERLDGRWLSLTTA